MISGSVGMLTTSIVSSTTRIITSSGALELVSAVIGLEAISATEIFAKFKFN